MIAEHKQLLVSAFCAAVFFGVWGACTKFLEVSEELEQTVEPSIASLVGFLKYFSGTGATVSCLAFVTVFCIQAGKRFY